MQSSAFPARLVELGSVTGDVMGEIDQTNEQQAEAIIDAGGGPRRLKRLLGNRDRTLSRYAEAMRRRAAAGPAEHTVAADATYPITGKTGIDHVAVCHWRAWLTEEEAPCRGWWIVPTILAPYIIFLILPIWFALRTRRAVEFTTAHPVSEAGARRLRRAVRLDPLLRRLRIVLLLLGGSGAYLTLLFNFAAEARELATVAAVGSVTLFALIAVAELLRRAIEVPVSVRPLGPGPFQCYRVELRPFARTAGAAADARYTCRR